MGIEETLNNLPQEEKEKIKSAFLKVYNKMFADRKQYDYLKSMFSEYVENIEQDCSKCRKRIVGFWHQRLKNWKML
jgi:flagellar motor component MotA